MPSISTDPTAVGQRQLEADNARDLDTLMGTFAADTQLFEHPTNLLARGVAAMLRAIQRALPRKNLHAPLLNRIVSGNHVLDHERVTRTFPQGPDTIELVIIYEVQHGRITQAWSIPEAMTLERTE